ncbi:MAG TPA: hypothetical protein VGG28_30655 [Kofleriaceae bacterium]
MALAAVGVGCGDDVHPKATVSGTVRGLVGTGLVIADTAGDISDTLAISANGSFTFKTALGQGASYAVTVKTQPSGPAQLCQVTNGTGVANVLANASITDVVVDCSVSAFTIGGTVIGLHGTGLVLEDNGSDDLSIGSDGAFTFATPIASGASFAVTIAAQPSGPTQNCVVSGGTGSVIDASVTTVVVNCSTDGFTISGTISGLASSVVLQDNGGDNTTVTSNGTFAFLTPVASGGSYNVKVLTEPSGPTQSCQITGGSGPVTNMDITSVMIVCTTTPFSISVTVSGLMGSGLDLQDNGSDDLAVGSNGTYTFMTDVLSGSGYDVEVHAQPIDPYQSCGVSNGSGTVGGQAVTGILVNCDTDTFAVNVAISGLAGTIDVQDNGSDDLVESADGTYAFATPVASGSNYNVTIANHTGPSQTCVIGNGSAEIADAPATATIACTTNAFTVGGTLSGLATGEQVVLEDNGGDDLTLGSNGSFTFATSVLSGSGYDVTVETDPGSPIAESCGVASGSGSVGSGPVTSVDVSCAPVPFSVQVVATGLTGPVQLVDNLSDDLTVGSNGTYTFAAQVPSGSTYDVEIVDTNGQECLLTANQGTIGTGTATASLSCGPCFTFSNDASANLTGNDWFDSCVSAVGSTIVVELHDTAGHLVYEGTGPKVGTWTDDLVTSTDTAQYSYPDPPGYYTEQFAPSDHSQLITFTNGDTLMVPGQSASNGNCQGSLGDGYGIVIYGGAPQNGFNDIRLLVEPYNQSNYQVGTPREFNGWSANAEISYDSGTVMDTCGISGEPLLTGFDGTFSFYVLP